MVGAARPWHDGYQFGNCEIYATSGQSLTRGVF